MTRPSTNKGTPCTSPHHFLAARKGRLLLVPCCSKSLGKGTEETMGLNQANINKREVGRTAWTSNLIR